MKRQWMNMKFNEELDCWLVVYGENEFKMHCGEWLYLRTGDSEGIPCRIELGKDWYIVMGREGVKLNLMTKEIYQVEI